MKYLLYIILILFSLQLFSQGVAINDDGTAPNVNAILDIDNTGNDKGILIPRISTGERTSIAGLDPGDEGLTVYDETTNCFWLWDGAAWIQFAMGSSSGWGLTGNATTVSGTNFLGTTDNVDFDIRVNNIIKLRLQTNGTFEFLNTGNSIFIGENAGINDDLSSNQNIFIGNNSGTTNTTGQLNVAIGSLTMNKNQTGERNVVYGYYSLYSNTSGSYNIAFGSSSLWSNTKGGQNIAIGSSAMYGNTTAQKNIAIGTDALKTQSYNNGDAIWDSYNIAIGYQSLFFNQPSATTNGRYNTSVGHLSQYDNSKGSQNTSLGHETLNNNTAANNNIAIGYQSLYTQSYANGGTPWDSYNLAIGNFALYNNQPTGTADGFKNTAIGHEALFTNTTGFYNTALGASSLYTNATGSYNTALGFEALYTNTGSENTAIGYYASRDNQGGGSNVSVGPFALWHTTSGTGNIGIGKLACDLNTTGDYNTVIGYNADVTSNSTTNSTVIGFNATAGSTNSTAIGYGATSSSNSVILGNTSVGTIGGYAAWSNISDARFKTNIKEDVSGLDFIMKLRPVSYNLEITKLNEFLGVTFLNENKQTQKSIHNKEAIIQTGFIAQEVEKAAQELGFEFNGVNVPKTKKEHYGLSYSSFVVPLVKAVQEQQEIITKQQKQIDALLKRIEALE